jgi:hypothetical protein
MNKVQLISMAALAVMGLAGVAAGMVAGNSTTSVVRSYFDNGLDRPVKVELDGKPALELAAHSAKVYESLAVGEHQVRILDEAGKPVEEAKISVPANKGLAMHRWAYNVKQASHYKVRYLAYGNATPPAAKDLPDGRWLELPDVHSVFLPAEGAAEKGKAATTLAVVGHREVHADTPCCTNLQALMKK